jgi:hypothetical protein
LEPLANLGLWGDGDEVWAIEAAFEAIGVELPVEDAARWATVGDLWTSVRRLAPDTADSEPAWNQFRRAICEETDVDWTRVTLETRLLDGRGHSVLHRLITSVRERFHGNG